MTLYLKGGLLPLRNRESVPSSTITSQPSQITPGLSHPDTWLDSYGDYLYRYALFRLNEPAVAEDVVQETLLCAIKAQENFSGAASERMWLLGIMRHKIVDHIRKSQRESLVYREPTAISDMSEDVFDAHGQWNTNISSWSHPDKSLEQEQFWPILNDCIANLPPKLAQAFVLREIDGMTNDEICKELEISTTNNLWVMLSRARMRLRNCLDANWFNKTGGGNR